MPGSAPFGLTCMLVVAALAMQLLRSDLTLGVLTSNRAPSDSFVLDPSASATSSPVLVTATLQVISMMGMISVVATLQIKGFGAISRCSTLASNILSRSMRASCASPSVTEDVQVLASGKCFHSRRQFAAPRPIRASSFRPGPKTMRIRERAFSRFRRKLVGVRRDTCRHPI